MRKLLNRSMLAPLLAVLAIGCASTGKLGEYTFRDRGLAVVAVNTPPPEILTSGYLYVDVEDPVKTAIRIGANLFKTAEANRARPRLDSAAARARLEERMTSRLQSEVGRELRTRPVEELRDADFELELRVKRYGIDGDNFFAPTHFHFHAEAILLDARTGRRIWKTKVKERVPLSTALRTGFDEGWPLTVAEDVITAARLSAMSTEEMTRMLEALADFSSRKIADRLHRGMERARRRNEAGRSSAFGNGENRFDLACAGSAACVQ